MGDVVFHVTRKTPRFTGANGERVYGGLIPGDNAPMDQETAQRLASEGYGYIRITPLRDRSTFQRASEIGRG